MGFTQHPCIISQSLWIRNPGTACWVLCFRVSHKASVSRSTRAGVLYEGLTGDGVVSKLIWLLAGSVSSTMFDGCLSQVLSTWVNPIWQCASSKYVSLDCRRDQTQGEVVSIYKLMMEVTSHCLCCVLFVRSKLLRQPPHKGRWWHHQEVGTLGTSEGRPAMSIHIGTKVCNPTKPFSGLRNVCIARTDQTQVIVEFNGMVINKRDGVADSLRKVIWKEDGCSPLFTRAFTQN